MKGKSLTVPTLRSTVASNDEKLMDVNAKINIVMK